MSIVTITPANGQGANAQTSKGDYQGGGISPCLAAALDYLERGWWPIPLCDPRHTIAPGTPSPSIHPPNCKKPGKVPIVADWTNARLDAEQLREIWARSPQANVGLLTGTPSGIVAIDLDSADDIELYRRLCEKHGHPPDTVEFTTGGGGARIFFQLRPGETIASTTYREPGVPGKIELLSDGRQTVMPPSMHKNGEPYKWRDLCKPGEVPLADMPEWFLILFKPASERAAASEREQSASCQQNPTAPSVPTTHSTAEHTRSMNSANHTLDRDWLITSRVERYLVECDEAISGRGGHNQIFKVVCHIMHGFTDEFVSRGFTPLSDDEIFALLCKEYNPRCQPPWSEAELHHKVKDAREKGHASSKGATHQSQFHNPSNHSAELNKKYSQLSPNGTTGGWVRRFALVDARLHLPPGLNEDLALIDMNKSAIKIRESAIANYWIGKPYALPDVIQSVAADLGPPTLPERIWANAHERDRNPHEMLSICGEKIGKHVLIGIAYLEWQHGLKRIEGMLIDTHKRMHPSQPLNTKTDPKGPTGATGWRSQASAPPEPLFKPVPWSVLRRYQDGGPDWVWHQVICKGSIHLLHSNPKLGKSTWFFHLIAAVLDGQIFLGRATRTSRFILISD